MFRVGWTCVYCTDPTQHRVVEDWDLNDLSVDDLPVSYLSESLNFPKTFPPH